MIMTWQGLQFWLTKTQILSLVTSQKPEAKFYHYDVIMAKSENLASQICCSAHWESNFGDGLQKSFFVLLLSDRQTISFVFLLSFSNPDHDLSKLKEM